MVTAWYRRTRHTAAACLVALALMALTVLPASADDRNFDFYNISGQAVIAFFIGPSVSPDWGPNLLPDDAYIGNDSVAPVTFNRFNVGLCLYDVQVVTEDGSVWEVFEVNLCEVIKGLAFLGEQLPEAPFIWE